MFRTWTLVVISSAVALVATVVTINVIVDAYGILRKDFSYQFQVPNMNYIKMKYLLNNKDRYDSYIFGSSRVGNIDQSKISAGTFYNMTYPLGLPEEHLRNIRFMLKSGISVRNIMIGIDEFSLTNDPEIRRSNLLFQPHPGVSGKPMQTFYGEYFFKLKNTLPQLKKYIRYNYLAKESREEHRFIYDFYVTGRILCPQCDESIERTKDTPRRFTPPQQQPSGNYISSTANAIREIATIAKKNNINLTIFMNPASKAAYCSADIADYARLKKELANVVGYYDFSGLNSITENEYFYYEVLHYRSIVGDMMLKTMFGAPDVNVPADFGVYVNRGNVDQHLYHECRKLKNACDTYDLSGINKQYSTSCDGLTSAVTKSSIDMIGAR